MGPLKVLAINPGSTSTKVALFEDGREIWNETQRYDTDVLEKYGSVMDQEDFRLDKIRGMLREKGADLGAINAFVGRGGLLRPIESGTYIVNEKMLSEVRECRWGCHASNLGALLASRFAAEAGCDCAYIVDPVVVDELCPPARYTGLVEIGRRSIFHALNQKMVARRAAEALGKSYDESHLIVAHMGGGISVGAHHQGRVIDVNNALDGDGPFSPERSGSLPTGGLVRLVYSKKYDLPEMLRMIAGKGGLIAHMGTNDLREVERRIAAGDEHAKLIFETMAYQVSKEIGSCAAVLEGRVDAIVVTGGLAYSEKFVTLIRDKVSFIAPVLVYPGEDELRALAEGAFRVLRGEEQAREYE